MSPMVDQWPAALQHLLCSDRQYYLPASCHTQLLRNWGIVAAIKVPIRLRFMLILAYVSSRTILMTIKATQVWGGGCTCTIHSS